MDDGPLGARALPRRRPGSRATSGFGDDEFKPFNQFTKGQIHVISHQCQSFEWFTVVDEKSRISRRNKATGVASVKKAPAELGTLDIIDRGRMQDLFRVFPSETNRRLVPAGPQLEDFGSVFRTALHRIMRTKAAYARALGHEESDVRAAVPRYSLHAARGARTSA
ncbi:peptidase M16 domain-containing protein [Marssonina coronariae]|uniref:Peptidase M16 domain-containing protein n=1 Tax=Diplocarpon coronariae TaxID=2795749 RepID=A0A218ZF68_9HELO|nr:peptidase M16 domain-containing protein [Marssonina coronariae]